LELNGLRAATDYDFKVTVSNRAGKSKAATIISTAAVSDYDGNFYRAVKIGNQTWLQENFRGTHYANGDPIANVTDPVTWSTLTTGAYCWYNNDTTTPKEYGALYNWYVGSDPRGLIVGWHVPTFDEQSDLVEYLGGYYVAYYELIEVGSAHWQKMRYATNSSGFTALPNGSFGLTYKSPNDFVFDFFGTSASFWTSDRFGSGATVMDIDVNKGYVSYSGVYNLKFGFGLRLLKN